MSDIVRFSIVYETGEDRLALDAVDAGGAATRLWITQRLCRSLVQALIPMLETAQPAEAQSWAQAAAMEGFGRTPGVRPTAAATVGLAHTVHMTPGAGHVAVAFEFGHGERRGISLSLPALRQTLTVIYRLQKAAGWPLDLWPAWIADPAAEATTTGAVN